MQIARALGVNDRRELVQTETLRGNISAGVSVSIYIATSLSYLVLSSIAVSYVAKNIAATQGFGNETAENVGKYAYKLAATSQLFVGFYTGVFKRTIVWAERVATRIVGVSPYNETRSAHNERG